MDQQIGLFKSAIVSEKRPNHSQRCKIEYKNLWVYLLLYCSFTCKVELEKNDHFNDKTNFSHFRISRGQIGQKYNQLRSSSNLNWSMICCLFYSNICLTGYLFYTVFIFWLFISLFLLLLFRYNNRPNIFCDC